MTRAVMAALIIALLPASARAQAQQGKDRGPPTARTDSEKKNDAAIDQAYQAAVKGTGEKAKPVKVDPWQSLRPADASDNVKR